MGKDLDTGTFGRIPGQRDVSSYSGTIPVKPGWLEYMLMFPRITSN